MPTATEQTNSEIQSKTPEVKAKAKVVDFGNGRYSNLMCEVYKDLQRIFGIESEHAEKVARRIGSDYGAVMSGASGVGIAGIKIGKASKDGKVNVKEAGATLKGTTLSYPLAVLKSLATIDALAESFISVSDSKLVLTDKVASWIESLKN